jgi:hypothetical protein
MPKAPWYAERSRFVYMPPSTVAEAAIACYSAGMTTKGYKL